MREQARALTGWTNRWKPGVGDYDFHYDRRRHDAGRQDGLQASRARTTGRTRATCACSTRCTRRSSSRSSGATSSRSRPTPRPRRRSRRSTATPSTRSSRSSRRSCCTRRCTPARAWSSRRSSTPPGLLRADGRIDQHHGLGVDRRALRPAALLPAERRGLGRHALARHGDLPRPLDRRAAAARRRSASTRRSRRRAMPTEPPALVDAGDRSSGTSPSCRPRRGRALTSFAHEAIAGRRLDELEAAAVPGARRERAAPPDRRSPRTCRRHERPVRLRRVQPRVPAARGRGPRPAGDRAGHAAAGRHRADAARLRREVARARARRLRRGQARPVRGGHRERGGRGRPAACSSACSCRAAPTRSRVLAPTGDPLYRKLRPSLVRRRRIGRSPHDDRARAGTRRSRRSRSSTPRARSSRSRRSATTTPTSRTSPLATSGRSAPPTRDLQTGWLGRYLDATGSADNPLQGLSLDRLAAAVARDGQGPGRRDRRRRTSTTSTRRACGARSSDRMLDAHRRARRRARSKRPGARDGGRRDALSPTACAASCRRSHRPTGSRRRSPTRSGDPFPTQLAGPRGDDRRRACRSVRRARGLRPVRHARGPGGRADARADGRPPRRCSRSSATSRRAASPTACSRSSGRSSAGARRRTAPAAPTTARPAPASSSARARRAAGRRVPGPRGARRRRQPAGDERLPLGLLLAARAVARLRRRAGHPGRGRASRARSSCSEDRPRALAVFCASSGPLLRRRPVARAGLGEGVLVHAVAAARRRRAVDDRARQLRHGPARPARPAGRCASHRRHAAGRARRPRRPGAEASPGQVPVLVLDREPPAARHARHARRHATLTRPTPAEHPGGRSAANSSVISSRCDAKWNNAAGRPPERPGARIPPTRSSTPRRSSTRCRFVADTS